MAQNIPMNLFEVPRQNIWNSFSNHLEGSHIGAFLIVSSSLLSEEAKTALLNSSKALGYGTINTTFLTLKNSDDSDMHTAKLEHQEIFRIVESLDPLCVVVTDHGAIEEVARAFRARLEIETPTTLLGHYCCCFNDFERMLDLEKTKQLAWSLLKTLPKHN